LDLESRENNISKKEDTLRKRYAFKLSANFIGSGISAVIQLMVPRSLGPAVYGNFGFMTAFFDNVVNSLDVGSSTWFYTRLSQKKHDIKIVFFYRLVMAVMIFAVLIFIFITTITDINQKIWIDQSKQIIYLAVLYSIMMWILNVDTKMMDAYGLTVNSEKVRIIQRIIALLIISILFVLHKLNLVTFFIYHYFIIILLLFLYAIIARRGGYSVFPIVKIKKEEGKYYLKSLYRYIYPLAVYTIIGLVIGIVDRWLLQKFGGSIQQGYFTLSFKISAIISLFTVSLTPLLMREFSIAFGKKDIKNMRAMFRRYLPIMYAIVTYLSCFVAAQYDKIVLIVGGGEYKEAGLVVMIMAFYPLHLTYGQLTSTIYFATGQTRLYRNIGIAGLILGLPLVYFLLAPRSMFGLGAGATGLAVKMVLVNIITVNIWLYFNAKFLKLSFGKFLLHQFGSIVIMISVAVLSRLGIDMIPVLGNNLILSFLLSGAVYTIIMILISNYFPKLLGMDRESLKRVKERSANLLRDFISRIRKK
jgi:O-antigen/teichoic acid export membrane protein